MQKQNLHRPYKPEDVQALLDAATVGLHLMQIRGLDKEELDGLRVECDMHERAGSLIPLHPPFLRRVLDIIEQAGLIVDEHSEPPLDPSF